MSFRLKRRAFGQIPVFPVAVFFGLVILALLPIFHRARENVRRSDCQFNLRVIALALAQYQADENQKFPPAGADYAATLYPFIEGSANRFECRSAPRGDSNSGTDYFFNARLNGLERAGLSQPERTILGGDGDGRATISQLPRDWAPSMRHQGGANYAFADGHAKWLQPESAAKNSFEPKIRAAKKEKP